MSELQLHRFLLWSRMPSISVGIFGRQPLSMHLTQSGVPQTQVVVLQLGLHPIFQRLNRLSDNKVFNKGREVAGDLRERWETSDSPLVQRIQASPPPPPPALLWIPKP